MKIVIYILIGIAVIFVGVIICLRIYFYSFAKKTIRINKKITEMLDNGMLQAFRDGTPYEEIKSEYFNFLSLLTKYSEFIHFSTMQKEKKYERMNDYMVIERKEEGNEKVVRIHIRAFPLRSLIEKFNARECIDNVFEISDYILKEKKEANYIELISHNRLLSEKIVEKSIMPKAKQHQLICKYDPDYDISYLSWILAETYFIHNNIDYYTEDGYNKLRKINKVVNIILK